MCCNAPPRPTRNSRPSTGRNPVPADPRDWDINPEALLRVRTNIAAIAAHADADADPDESPRDTRTTTTSRCCPSMSDLEDEPATDGADRDWTETPVDVGSR